MKKFVSLILSLSLIFTLASCAAEAEGKRFSKSFFDLFDTASTIVAYDESQADFNNNFKMVFDEIEVYSQLFDIYKDYEGVVNLKYVNENAGKAPVKVDERIIQLLNFGVEAYSRTNGYVNICMGSVLSVWHSARENANKSPENAKLPDMNMLNEKSKHTDISNLSIDFRNNTVFFKDSEMSLDVGAIAKGYVAEKICSFITENNIWQSATVSIGGNLKTIGSKGNQAFAIGIESPKANGQYLSTVFVSNGKSVVTSGDYQRYFTVNGKRYCHIIDKNSLMPADKNSSVTVITSNSADADMYSTALFLMNAEDGKTLVDSTEGVEAIWVKSDGKIIRSSGFKKYEVR